MRALLAAIGLLLGSCGGARPDFKLEGGEAEILVLAYTGLSRTVDAPPPSQVSLVADVTALASSRGQVEADEAEQLAWARRQALAALPSDTAPDSLSLVAFDRLGDPAPSQCAPPRSAWAASALERLGTDGGSPTSTVPPRVVLVADLEKECEADLCRASGALIEAGTWLDVVSLGAAPEPACLRERRPDVTRPGRRVRQATPAPPRFRIERPGSPAGEGQLLAQGTTGGPPVRVPAGLVRVVIELDVEEWVGPFVVAPGERMRVRVQSFPRSPREARAWVVDALDDPAAR